MTPKEQQTVADDLLSKLRTVDEDVIISGGAPRDWYLGRSAKDLDVYIKYDSTKSELENYKRVKQALPGVGIPGYCTDKEYPGFGWAGIELLLGFFYKGIKVQVMLLKEEPPCSPFQVKKTFAEKVCSSHDAGICRVYYNEGGIQTTTAFTDDCNNHTITWFTTTLSEESIVHSVRLHLPKILNYFPNHKLVLA